MARTHSRSSSPDASTVKRLKISHIPNGNYPATVISDTDPTTQFSSGLFDPAHIVRLGSAYQSNRPFKYALVEKLFQDDLLNKVKDECLSELSFTEKETDIYKVNQTGDLASLNYLTPAQIALLPNLLALRDALYSREFRNFLCTVTSCGPLSGKKQDMSVNSYTKGCHLLNHDDVIGTRRVSYILYMPLPNYQLWQKDWGGALELYPVKTGSDGTCEPEPIPRKSIPPSWNQFVFFEVQPGKSFHSVEEIVVGEGEDGRQRLSISGWFHAAQEGEEGYVPEPISDAKSSRQQLTETETIFTPYRSGEEESLSGITALSEADSAFLSEYLNPVYLQTRTMNALASRFVEESSLELHSFLCNDLAEALEPRLRDLDVKDGLGPDRGGRVPPHSAGVNLTSTYTNTVAGSSEGVNTVTINTSEGGDSPWALKGPPHKWRYCTLAPQSPDAPATSITPLSAHPSPSEILRVLQDELFPSMAFRSWLALVSRMLPLQYNIEARRFRPGLDYTLATSEENEARLDVVLGLTPNVLDEEDEEEIPDKNAKSGKLVRGWDAAEWGGWECYMAPHDEEDDPAVYRAGTYKKSAVPGAPGHANGTIANGMNGHTSGSPKTNGKKGPEAMEIDEAEDEEDSTLLTVQPGFNRLLLVLRDEKVMRFVKYVSAAAEGSRWDICGEYEIGVLQEDSEDED